MSALISAPGNGLPSPLSQSNAAQATVARPELTKALAGAILKCQAVVKDSTNTFHHYRYASAEAIIAEARGPLAESGLALVPIEQSLNGTSREGSDPYELHRKFLLLHSSGECLPIAINWPVCPEKGRPLDKATAIAATTSLAYLLRDLLQMPRVDPEDDLAGRREPLRAPPANRQQLDQIEALSYQLHLSAEQLAGQLTQLVNVGEWQKLNANQADQAIDFLKKRKEAVQQTTLTREQTLPDKTVTPPPASSQQLDQIDALGKELGLTADQISQRLVKLYGFGDWKKLDAVQADEVIGLLKKRKQPAPTGTRTAPAVATAGSNQ